VLSAALHLEAELVSVGESGGEGVEGVGRADSDKRRDAAVGGHKRGVGGVGSVHFRPREPQLLRLRQPLASSQVSEHKESKKDDLV